MPKSVKQSKIENYHYIVTIVIIIVIIALIYFLFTNYKDNKDNIYTEEGLQNYHRNFIYENFQSDNYSYRNKPVLSSIDPTNISDQDIVIVKFYAPWCGHCKNLAPTWENITQKLSGKQSKGGKQIWITKLDADANSQQAQAHGIQGFPTIKVFNGSNVSEYKGNRDMNSLESFITNM